MIALFLLACSGGTDSADPYAGVSGVVAELGENVWLPRYADFSSEAAVLSGSVSSFCSAPSEDGLAAARSAWWSAKEPWKLADSVAFGPYTEWGLRLGPEIDGWPTRPDLLQEVIDDTAPVDANMLGSTSTGLPALGWLLFASEAADFTERRCALAVALAVKLSADAELMVSAWSAEGADTLGALVDPSSNTEDDFMSSGDVLEEVFNRTLFAVENVRLIKLGKPAGLENGGAIDASLLEAPYSGRSLQDARDNIHGVLQNWSGTYGDSDGQGLVDLLPAGTRDELDALVQSTAAEALDALEAIPEPLVDSLSSSPSTVNAAIGALLPLQVALQVDVAQALQVTIQFNDADGD